MHTVWTSWIIIIQVEIIGGGGFLGEKDIKVYTLEKFGKKLLHKLHDKRSILSRKHCIVNMDCRHHGHLALLLL